MHLSPLLLYINWRVALSGRLGFFQGIAILIILALILWALYYLDGVRERKRKNNNPL